MSSDHPGEPAAPKTYTGYRRDRKTHWSIAFKDRLAAILITAGGLGTIVAVATMCLFLVAVVIPLFLPPAVEGPKKTPHQWSTLIAAGEGDHRQPLHLQIDDYNLMGWAVFADGSVHKFRTDNGEILDRSSLNPGSDAGVTMTAWSFPQSGSLVAIGYSDGSVRLCHVRFELGFIEADAAPEPLRALKPGEILTWENGLAQMTTERQLRLVTLKVEVGDALPGTSQAPVVRLDHGGTADSPVFAAMHADGLIRINRVVAIRSMMDPDKVTFRPRGADLPFQAREVAGQPVPPDWIKLTGLGDNVYAIWADGRLDRYNTADFGDIRLVEAVDVKPANGSRITTVSGLIGKTTLMIGDAGGEVTTYFRTRPAESTDPEMRQLPAGSDGSRLQRVAVLDAGIDSPVTSISTSQRKRMVAIGHEDGAVNLFNVTNTRLLASERLDDKVNRVALNPRDDGLIAISNQGIGLWSVDIEHPEASLGALFTKVWYEGYNEPTHTWQSTGGTDDFEGKYGMWPLVFGTIKATVFAMLFAVPVAILAAIYTSEFLTPSMKSRIKPTIEMMASLPSVVLGFLAGLVIAQFVEGVVPAILCIFLTVPLAFLIGAYVWQLLPAQVRHGLARIKFFIMVLVCVPLGLLMAFQLGPIVERAFFWVEDRGPVLLAEDEVKAAHQALAAAEAPEARAEAEAALVAAQTSLALAEANPRIQISIRNWLSAGKERLNPERPVYVSSSTGGWLFIFLPISLLSTAWLFGAFVNPALIRVSRSWTWHRLATLDALKFVAGLICAVTIAIMLSWIVGGLIGWDARGTYIDQYVQRNALIVGVIMGFAVIPIIYTIADDAMSAVPEHLRSASLGAGATPWQTATRVIIPTAMSGMFSAVMIGFGRAVGETMIVLMAAGNTPIMEWNIFNGFRTLSANIAVEMMEAVKNSTNYRILFLAALTLFIMTFFINTVAESIRQHYRKKAYEL